MLRQCDVGYNYYGNSRITCTVLTTYVYYVPVCICMYVCVYVCTCVCVYSKHGRRILIVWLCQLDMYDCSQCIYGCTHTHCCMYGTYYILQRPKPYTYICMHKYYTQFTAALWLYNYIILCSKGMYVYVHTYIYIDVFFHFFQFFSIICTDKLA